MMTRIKFQSLLTEIYLSESIKTLKHITLNNNYLYMSSISSFYSQIPKEENQVTVD